MDRIVVRTNADMQRVLDWAEVISGMAVKLMFPEGEIEFQEEMLLLRFWEEESPVVRFSLEVQGKRVAEWRSNLETGEMVELHISGEGERKLSLGMLLAQDNTLGKCVRKFRAIMLFSAYYREEVERTRVVSRMDRKSGSSRKKGGGSRKLTVRRYTVSEELLGELPAPKKEWHGYRESFGVRGHYRTYKTGKTVWVRPYEKKGRLEKRSDKEYVL